MVFTENEQFLLDNIRRLCRERQVKNKELAAYLGIKGNVISEWFGGRCRSFTKYVHAIAAFFSLPVEALTKGELSASTTDNDTQKALKLALFGGDGEVTDEMWEEVRNFAAYVKEKHRKD